MACELTTGRALDCRDTVGGVKAIYLAQHDSVNIGGGAGASIEPSSGEVNDVDLTGSGTGSQLFKYNLVRGLLLKLLQEVQKMVLFSTIKVLTLSYINFH